MESIEYTITADDIEPIVQQLVEELDLTFDREDNEFLFSLGLPASIVAGIIIEVDNNNLWITFALETSNLNLSHTRLLELERSLNEEFRFLLPGFLYIGSELNCRKILFTESGVSEYYVLRELAHFFILIIDKVIPYLIEEGVIPNE